MKPHIRKDTWNGGYVCYIPGIGRVDRPVGHGATMREAWHSWRMKVIGNSMSELANLRPAHAVYGPARLG